MSDFSQGEGWWQASDGKWYPPQTAPPSFSAPAPAPTPPKGGLGTGPIVAIVVAVVAVIGGIVFLATRSDDEKKNVAATQSSSESTRSSSSSRLSSSSRSSASSSSGAPDVDAPPGFKVHSNDADEFALAIPESFEVIDVSAGDLDEIIERLSEANPGLADMADQIKSIFSSGGKLVAIDPDASEGFSDNLNIIVTPGTGDVTSLTAQEQIRQQIETFATNVEFDEVQAHGRSILTASYEATINRPDGTPALFYGRQAYIPAGGRVWVLTFSTGSAAAELFGDIVSSFDVNE